MDDVLVCAPSDDLLSHALDLTINSLVAAEFELQEEKNQRMPPWKYLGLEIGENCQLRLKAKPPVMVKDPATRETEGPHDLITWGRGVSKAWNIGAASTVVSQRGEHRGCATSGAAPRALAAPGGDTKAKLGGRQQDHGVHAPAVHRQAKSGRLGIPGSGVEMLVELQPPRICEHCSDHRGLVKWPGPGSGLGRWPREQMILQFVALIREEQGQCWLGEPVGKGLQHQDIGKVLTLLGGKVSWCEDGLVPWEGGGALGQSGQKSCGWPGMAGSVHGLVAGDLVPKDMAWSGGVWHGMEQRNVGIAV
ncbi:hypothetical protein DUI87_31716 [Hirundo rustica rustica]|uniref:ribonuclease H n=1 Tax=Hirundo rustica rustica TaxID=333673 RepID=A0A3M0JB63_HIRRU|nr:hypothetical protein DUI87_31716 [Hirundo rustica rustica]